MSSLAYRDPDGHWHQLLIAQTEEGDWQVLDVCGERTEVIDTLDGRVEGLPQAEAIVRDYLSTIGDRLPRRPATPHAIPEEAEADAHSDSRVQPAVRDRHARGVALPRKAA